MYSVRLGEIASPDGVRIAMTVQVRQIADVIQKLETKNAK